MPKNWLCWSLSGISFPLSCTSSFHEEQFNSAPCFNWKRSINCLHSKPIDKYYRINIRILDLRQPRLRVAHCYNNMMTSNIYLSVLSVYWSNITNSNKKLWKYIRCESILSNLSNMKPTMTLKNTSSRGFIPTNTAIFIEFLLWGSVVVEFPELIRSGWVKNEQPAILFGCRSIWWSKSGKIGSETKTGKIFKQHAIPSKTNAINYSVRDQKEWVTGEITARWNMLGRENLLNGQEIWDQTLEDHLCRFKIGNHSNNMDIWKASVPVLKEPKHHLLVGD